MSPLGPKDLLIKILSMLDWFFEQKQRVHVAGVDIIRKK